MKILLVHPDPLKTGFIKSKKITSINQVFFDIRYRPNLMLLTLAALTPQKHQVEIVDDIIHEINFDKDYDLIGITVMTNGAIRSYEIADRFKEKGKMVILGGWHASALPDEAKKHADSVVIGEAEENWPRVLNDLENAKLRPFYKQNKPVDLKRVPVLSKEKKLNKKLSYPETVEATRGCPVGCTFCSISNRPFYRNYRKKEINKVIQEIEHIPWRFFNFADSSLTLDPEYSKELFRKIKPLNKTFSAMGNLDFLSKDDDLLKTASDAGLSMILVGLESPFQKTLDLIGKNNYHTHQYKSVIRKIHDYGISVLGYFMFGLDTDRKKIFDDTINFLSDIEIDIAGLCVLTPYPGTPLFEKLDRENRILTKDWSKYDMNTAVFQPRNMTPTELESGTQKVAKEFYSLDNVMKRIMKSKKYGFYPFSIVAAINYMYLKWAKQF